MQHLLIAVTADEKDFQRRLNILRDFYSNCRRSRGRGKSIRFMLLIKYKLKKSSFYTGDAILKLVAKRLIDKPKAYPKHIIEDGIQWKKQQKS